MGEVYLAEDPRLGRNLAIKLLPRELDRDEERLDHLVREAKAASALNHPNIITVYEVDQANGAYYLATEFIGGITLRERMGNVGMPVREVMEIAAQVALGLSAAHAAGIVHRDIKPENIVIRPDGLAKIVDFGLAKVADEAADKADTQTTRSLDMPGRIVGTIGYMSPEQARGQEVDGRTDIFSLGTLLYEMLGGQPPFRGETASDVMAAILTAEPPPLRQLSPEVPPKLERIVGRMMAKDPEGRYQSSSEVLADLTAARKEWEMETERGRPLRRRPRQESGKIKSLAVLPFQSASGGDPEAEYLSDGLTESLINSLSRLPHLKVISHSATLSYKGKPADVREVGRALKVQAVLTGRMVHQGEEISVSAELVNVRDTRQLWGSRYDRRLSDALALEQEITLRVSEKLGLKVTPDQQQRLQQHSTENKEAYHLYLKGRHWLGKRTRDGQKKAMDYFTRAIELDPSYALAYDGLAQSYLLTFLPLAPRDRMPRAKAAARKALEIDDTIAEARTSLARVKWQFDWDWAGAEREFKIAIDMNPECATAHEWYSLFLVAAGRPEEAVAQSKRGQEADPLSLAIHTNAGWVLYLARQYDEAIAQLRKALEMDENFVQAHRQLGPCYLQKGMAAEAVAEVEKAYELSGGEPHDAALLGYAYAVTGHKADAQALLARLQVQSRQQYVSYYYIAEIFTGLGDVDQAFKWLNKACDQREGLLLYLKVYPIFDGLRSDLRYKELVQRSAIP
jgi:serine/threonine protein kinase/tetratricopeptide (TPR) repeat protein